jgi:F0F1-type ATP synthase delta subunit
MEVTENPDLIAGVKVHVAGRVWDMSVKGMLRKAASQHA